MWRYLVLGIVMLLIGVPSYGQWREDGKVIANSDRKKADGEFGSEWLSAMRAESLETRAAALDELRERLERGQADAETISGLLLASLETDHVLQMQAAVLVDLVPDEAVSHLKRALSDPRPKIRARAAIALGEIGEKAVSARGDLLALIRNDQNEVARSASVALGKLDVAGESIPELLEMLKDPDLYLRHKAAVALDEFSTRIGPIVAEILPHLADEVDETQRYWLVIVVANAKHENSAVVATLTSLLRDDPSPSVRTRVAREFWEMGYNRHPMPDKANEALVHSLNHDWDEGVRKQAAKALASNRQLFLKNRATLVECSRGKNESLARVCRNAIRGDNR